MPKFDTLVLRAVNPEHQRSFYRHVLGMSNQGGNCLGDGSGELGIRFLQADNDYSPAPSDLYWKITLSVPNVELAYDQLQAGGVSITEPDQFRAIGYLAQAYDPDGFNIEIIEHWFKGHRTLSIIDTSLLGGGPHISLLALQFTDPTHDGYFGPRAGNSGGGVRWR